jgi:nickel/cobalt exporter
MDLLLLFGTALLLGLAHAFEADHMAAVSAFAVGRPGPLAALLFGVRWAAGHGAVLVVVGTGLVALGLPFPEAAAHWLERVVGVALVGLGVWTVLSARTLHAHLHTHADGTAHVHLHSHLFGRGHDHGHGATLMGALHGLAGTAPALALVPLARLDSALLAAGYLLLFAVGTAVAMALYAMLAGLIAGRAAARSAAVGRALAYATGAANIAVGVLWLLR